MYTPVTDRTNSKVYHQKISRYKRGRLQWLKFLQAKKVKVKQKK